LQKSHPNSLLHFEKKVFSQYGEDGVLAEIFRRIGTTDQAFVEFGIEDGTECNTRNLIEQGWTGLLIDGSETHTTKAKNLYHNYSEVKIKNAFINAENICELIGEHIHKTEFDLLSVDIDGNDYWVLKSILTKYRPRVIVVEYNARWLPGVEWIMPYDPGHIWNGSVWFGASLTSFEHLLHPLGYRLVHCTSTGNNAFFVISNDAVQHFNVSDMMQANLFYAPPRFHELYGHPVYPPVRRNR
jgi:hypothetical protein